MKRGTKLMSVVRVERMKDREQTFVVELGCAPSGTCGHVRRWHLEKIAAVLPPKFLLCSDCEVS